MVGISLGSLKRFSRWIANLSLPALGLAAVVVVVAAAGAVWGLTTLQTTARMLRSDPDAAASDPALMRFAASRGHAAYDRNCASCHGAKARGDSLRGIPDLADDDWLYGTGQASDIETIVLNGIRAPNSKTWRLADMPAFARRVPYPREPLIQPLAPGDIDDIIQFLYAGAGHPAPADAATRGAKIFSTRGGCWDCHGDGHGDSAIGSPNLLDDVWLFGGSPKAVFDSIAYGRAGFCPAWAGKLPPARIREIALYVYSLSHPSPSRPSPSA